MPSPLQILPNQFLTSSDGTWSPFPLQIGDSPLNVLVSTAQTIDYVIPQIACQYQGSTVLNTALCNSRGGAYNYQSSTTWNKIGLGSIDLASPVEPNTGEMGLYGTDTVQLGIQGTGGPSLNNSIVALIELNTYWTGYFGILPTTFTFDDVTQQTYFQKLFTQDVIPSLSWGYTAGGSYQNNGVGLAGSLIFGGYDANRFISNNLNFPMNMSSITTLLSLELSALSFNASDGPISFLSKPITVSLDSTLPYLWFSPDLCSAIAFAFDLQYNATANMYFVNDTLHNTLLSENPTFTFTFTDTGGQTANIAMPYGAFDLTATYPLVANGTQQYYFPLKQTNSTSYVLGRAFFQEAYVVANFENHTFSIGQAVTTPESKADIVTIFNNVTTTSSPSSKSSDAGAIAGGVVGGVLGAALLAFLAWFFLLRPGKGLRKKQQQRESDDHPEAAELSGQARAPASEKIPDDLTGRARSPGQDHVPPYTANELDASTPHELVGSMPPELSAVKDEAEHNTTTEQNIAEATPKTEGNEGTA